MLGTSALVALLGEPPPPHQTMWNPVCASFSGVVRDYILDTKTHMSQTCEDMEGGLTLSSHYVDVQVSQRDIVYRCGKNAHKAQDKEIIFTGDTHRQQSLLGLNQVTFFSTGIFYLDSSQLNIIFHSLRFTRSLKAHMETIPSATFCSLAMLGWEKAP